MAIIEITIFLKEITFPGIDVHFTTQYGVK